MGKKSKSSTPRRKRGSRRVRIENAKKWVLTYEGKDLVKGYSKWYGVDQLCAIIELEIIGYKISEKKKRDVQQTLEMKAKQKQRKKARLESSEDIEYDDLFRTSYEQKENMDNPKRYITEDDEFPFF